MSNYEHASNGCANCVYVLHWMYSVKWSPTENYIPYYTEQNYFISYIYHVKKEIGQVLNPDGFGPYTIEKIGVVCVARV